MTQLSPVIVANALALISVLGLSFQVNAQVTKIEPLAEFSLTDRSLGAISQIPTDQITAGSTTDADKLHIAQMSSQKRRRHWGEGLAKYLDRLDL
ncbi:MAG: hypothetical protein AB4206_15785, partial [Xenococcaceae cyanobacterium]